MGFFAKGRQSFADGTFAWNTNRLLCYLLDADDLGGASAGAWKISGATNPVGNTVRLTTNGTHNISVGHEIEVWGVGGVTPTTGIFVVTATPSGTQLEFTAATTPTGTYTSGGYVINLGPASLSGTGGPTFMSDINPGGTADIAKVVIPVAGRSCANGYPDAPNVVFPSVSGDPTEVFAVVYAAATDVSTNDANEAVQRLILCQTPATSGLSGLPQSPDGGNVNLDFAAQGLGRV